MTECILIGASPEATLPPQFTVGNSAVICADGGYDRAVSWGLHPDLVIGDFDSAHKLPEEPIPTIRLPQEKDDTDLLAAVKVAMEKGYTQFRILGALGGRIDHQYGNFSVLQFIAEHGGSATLEDGSTIVALRRSGDAPFLLEKQKGRTVSVFPFGVPKCVASYTGLQYPLLHGDLVIGVPLGVSNVVTEDVTSITIESGTAVIMVVDA